MRLLVTRPEPDGERTAVALRARGHEVVIAPVLRTESVAASFGRGPFAALVITSGNAVWALAGHPRRGGLMGLPLFAVGARSAEAARGAGFSEVVSADGNLDDLAGLLVARFGGSGAKLLHLAGEDRAGDLAGGLAAHGIKVETAAIYRAVPAEDFPDRLDSALAAAPLDGVLHYSRRSAMAFLAAAESAGVLDAALAAVHFCLSAEVAWPLAEAGAAQVQIAPRPNGASLIGLLSPD